MNIPVVIPSVGESITSGTIAEWHRKDGDLVRAGDVILTLETDKISTEVPAEADGILRIQVPAGQEVAIGATVALLEPAGVAVEAAPAKEPVAPPKAAAAAKPAPPAKAKPAAKPAAPAPVAEPESVPPLSFQVVPENQPSKLAPSVSVGDGTRVSRTKMTPLRRKISQHLVESQHSTATLTTFNECDMSAVMSLRKQLQESFIQRHGVKLGFMSFFVKAVVDALRVVPIVNARIEGDEIIQNHFYDIGVAIGTERGLIVPVLRDCERKNFAEIERDINDYADKAKKGKIQLPDLQGGVFTISNGGVYGSLLSTPLLNIPQSAILGMHAIQERPVAVEGRVAIRPMMYLALSYDHRLIDGKEAVTFLVHIKQCIEQPYRLFFGE